MAEKVELKEIKKERTSKPLWLSILLVSMAFAMAVILGMEITLGEILILATIHYYYWEDRLNGR